MRIEQVRRAVADTVWEEVQVLAEMRRARTADPAACLKQLKRAQDFHNAGESILRRLERGHGPLEIPFPR